MKNGVGILVERELMDSVVEVRRKSDRIMAIKVLVGSEFHKCGQYLCAPDRSVRRY